VLIAVCTSDAEHDAAWMVWAHAARPLKTINREAEQSIFVILVIAELPLFQ
jgi:hypothetical protein